MVEDRSGGRSARDWLDPDFSELSSGAPDALARFARQNGWEYYAYSNEVALPGLVFHEADGRDRFMGGAADIVRIPGRLLTEVGNSAYISQPAGHQVGRMWGYIALQIDTPVAPFVLQSRRTALHRPLPSLPILPTGLKPSIVGDGDRAFELYTYVASVPGAHALLTDRIRSLLDDGGVGFALESMPGWLFVYSPEKLSTLDASTWRRVLQLIDELRAQAATVASANPGAGFSAALPMRSNAWAVDRRHALWVYGLVAAGMVVAGLLGWLFSLR